MSANKTATSAPALAKGLLSSVTGRHRAIVTSTEPGIIAGLELLDPEVSAPTGEWKVIVPEGAWVEADAPLIEVVGTAAELAVAEDYVMGSLGFASGVATGAKAFIDAAPKELSIACGGWKKLPVALKPLLRAGLATVGVLPRLIDGKFIYVNKNAVFLLGSVEAAINAGRALNHGPVAIQVRNREEAEFAARCGAGVIMVDTAKLEDLADIHQFLQRMNLRNEVILAFGGGVKVTDLSAAFEAGAETVDVGRAILNSPLLDLRMQVID